LKTKKILIILISLITFVNLEAQERIGILGGTSISSYVGKDFPKTYVPNIGVAAGVFIEGIITYPVSIIFEANIEQKGVKYHYYPLSTTKVNINTKFNYISLPILLKAEIGSKFGKKSGYFVYAGPVVSYLLSSSYSASAFESGHEIRWQTFFDYSFANFDPGLSLGVGMVYREFFLDIRYIHGVKNIYKGEDIPDMRNHSITCKIGFSLYKRKKSRCYRKRL